MARPAIVLALVGLVSGCGGGSATTTPDGPVGGPADAAVTTPDAAVPDAARPDAPRPDAAAPDAGMTARYAGRIDLPGPPGGQGALAGNASTGTAYVAVSVDSAQASRTPYVKRWFRDCPMPPVRP